MDKQDQEGFQSLDDSVEIKYIQSSMKLFNDQKINPEMPTIAIQISIQPPVSSYIDIKNYITPSYLNSTYSYDSGKDCINDFICLPWQSSKNQVLENYFLKGYRCIYSRFAQSTISNPYCQYYREYARSEYKTFNDPEEIVQYQQSSIQYSKMSFNENQLVFCSKFESGNLSKVYQATTFSNNEYFLLLSNDTNTLGYNQWFYFKVVNISGLKKKKKFIICNIAKKMIKQLSKIGIACFSVQSYQQKGIGWHYHKQGLTINNNNLLKRFNGNQFKTLQFQYQFNENQIVYFAFSLPYTFTKLYNTLKQFNFDRLIIGRTQIGNPIFAIQFQSNKLARSILILARQHPSQISSSYVMEGVMKTLDQNSLCIALLKKKYNIYLIPMCNPDGVIHGNSRTNLFGFDINRKWQSNPISIKNQSFEVYFIYNFMKNIGEIQYLIDLHGHSKKLNSFAYFSSTRKFASLMALEMSSKIQWFRYADCTIDRFNSSMSSTLRGLGRHQLQINKVMTLQTSIHGWVDQQGKINCFKKDQLMKIGEAILESISNIQFKAHNILIKKNLPQINSDQLCSDSDPQGDYMPQKQSQPQQLKISSKSQIKFIKRSYRQKSVLNKPQSPKIQQRIKTQHYTCKKITMRLPTPKTVNSKTKYQHRYLKTADLNKRKKQQSIFDDLSVVSKVIKLEKVKKFLKIQKNII